ncbi:MAG: hypothetical protein PVG22_10930 [Chromatiales bacterium]
MLDSESGTFMEAVPLQTAGSISSQQCMACHDGSGGQAIALKHAESAMRYNGIHNVDHPVGMDYASYASRSPVEYVAPERLDRRIVLENGQVTCLSCHETKSPEQLEQENPIEANHRVAGLDVEQRCSATDRLTTGTHRTTLCLSCHDM